MMINFYNLDNQFIKKDFISKMPMYFTGVVRDPIDGFVGFLLNGLYHCLSGPAIEYASGSKQYWIHGKRITEAQYKLLSDIMKLKGIL